MATRVPNSEALRARPVRLSCWKEIAAYLEIGVRTAQRWHCDLHLPVHRVHATPRSPVFAFQVELDCWLWQRTEPNGSPFLSSGRRERAKASVTAEKAMKSSSKMALLVNQQHDRLNQLAEEVSRLAQLQKKTASKVS